MTTPITGNQSTQQLPRTPDQGASLSGATSPTVRATSFREVGGAAMEAIGACLKDVGHMLQDRLTIGVGIVAVTLDPRVSLESKRDAYTRGAANLRDELGEVVEGLPGKLDELTKGLPQTLVAAMKAAQTNLTEQVHKFNISRELGHIRSQTDKYFSSIEGRIERLQEDKGLRQDQQDWLTALHDRVGSNKQQTIEGMAAIVRETRDDPAARKARLTSLLTEVQDSLGACRVGLDKFMINSESSKVTASHPFVGELGIPDLQNSYRRYAYESIDGTPKGLKEALKVVRELDQDLTRRSKVFDRLQALEGEIEQFTPEGQQELTELLKECREHLSEETFSGDDFDYFSGRLKEFEVTWHQDLREKIADAATRAFRSATARMTRSSAVEGESQNGPAVAPDEEEGQKGLQGVETVATGLANGESDPTHS
jgi:hypothetical protein